MWGTGGKRCISVSEIAQLGPYDTWNLSGKPSELFLAAMVGLCAIALMLP